MKARVLESQTALLLRHTDWSKTSLGPMDAWPRSLRSYAAMIMDLPSPAIIFWGADQTQIYNDGYAQIMGPRHPRYFGAPYRDCWPDTYPLIYPWMRRVLDHAEVIEVSRERIALTRYGFEEDAFFTFTFSPLRDDDGHIGGILQPVFEVTDAVLSERRSAVLAELTPDRQGVRQPDDVLGVLRRAADDVPRAALYLRDPGDDAACRRRGAIGEPAWSGSALRQVDTAAERVLATGEPQLLDDAGALVLPLAPAQGHQLLGAIALGFNRRLHLDDRYREFLKSIGRQVATLLQRLAMQEAVDRQHAYLGELFLQVPAGIALLQGPEHVFELANPLFQSIVRGRAVLGRPIGEVMPELESQPFLPILDGVYRSGRPYVGTAEVARLEDNRGRLSERYFNYVFQPTRDDADRVAGILVFCYEVTDQVLARRHAEALTEQLRQEHRLKDEFLAMLAHELRNPLAPIGSAAELLRLGRLDAESIVTASAIIVRQVRHMTALVNDLLDVSRVTRGLVEIERQPQAMAGVVFDALEQVRPLVDARKHRLRPQLSGHDPVVIGDRKRLVQIVANLLTNAAKYTPDGGEISLTLSTADGCVELSVADNGIGIPAHLQSHIFDLFVQAQRSRDRTEGGLGIGLALVKSLTELHGGSVACESGGSGRGSRFTVRLPAYHAADATDDAPGRAPARADARRILVVDDNADAAEMLALLLRTSGHDVQVEGRAVQALDRARDFRPDVALLDIGLPLSELARQLRSRPETAGIVLIAVTGYGQSADRQRARQAGFDHYLVKPVDVALLEELLS